MNKFNFALLFYLALSCGSNVNYKFNNSKVYVEQFYDPISINSKADKSDTSVIFFTTQFDESKIELKMGNEVERKTVSTNHQIGLAYHKVVSNKEFIQIRIGQEQLEINPKHMKKYKFIYISKNEKNLVVEYSNEWKRFI